MSVKTWTARAGSFSSAQNWSLPSVPVAGDSLYVQSGTVMMAGQTFGSDSVRSTIGLIGETNAKPPTLVLWNETLDKVDISNAPISYAGPANQAPPDYYSGKHGIIIVREQVTNNGGVIEAGRNNRMPGSSLDVVLAQGATLINKGTLEAYPGSQLTISGNSGSKLENDASIGAMGGKVIISTHLTGTGDIYDNNAGAGLSSSVEIDAMVDAGQTFHVSRASLQIDQPLSFLGQIASDPTGPGGLIGLNGLDAASWDVNKNSLEFLNAAGSVIDTLRFTLPQDATTLDAAMLRVYVALDATHGQAVTVLTGRSPGLPPNATVLPYHYPLDHSIMASR